MTRTKTIRRKKKIKNPSHLLKRVPEVGRTSTRENSRSRGKWTGSITPPEGRKKDSEKENRSKKEKKKKPLLTGPPFPRKTTEQRGRQPM